ncbi:hypothetical protein ASPCAL02020 [Aspergillus calidoustus]|uniref:Uncharacterized protein n=1 Tax=Aspergillus calidoustus TaxID=454130 RepID=A0A0U5GRB6_ASPCI|nr:hypothetical protein ASPCAL02020 [Aspergillus calidoustus]
MALDYHPPFLAIVKTQAWSLEERVTILVAYQQGHFRITRFTNNNQQADFPTNTCTWSDVLTYPGIRPLKTSQTARGRLTSKPQADEVSGWGTISVYHGPLHQIIAFRSCDPEHSLLAVWATLYFESSLLYVESRGCFWARCSIHPEYLLYARLSLFEMNHHPQASTGLPPRNFTAQPHSQRTIPTVLLF